MADVRITTRRDAVEELLETLTEMAAGSVTEELRLNDRVVVDIRASWRFAGGFRLSFDDYPDALRLNELDLIFDVLEFTFRVDLPSIVAGGQCVVRDLAGRCVARLPAISLFTASSDVVIPVVLNGLRSEGSAEIDFELVHFRTEDANELSAVARGYRQGLSARLDDLASDTPPEVLDFFRMAWTDGWELRAEPHSFDLDVVDVSDMAAAAFDSQLQRGITDWAAGLDPGTRALLGSLASGATTFVRTVLDLPDDLQEFIQNALTSIHLIDQALTALSEQVGFLYLVKIPERPVFQVARDVPAIALEVADGSLNVETDELRLKLDVEVPDDV